MHKELFVWYSNLCLGGEVTRKWGHGENVLSLPAIIVAGDITVEVLRDSSLYFYIMGFNESS